MRTRIRCRWWASGASFAGVLAATPATASNEVHALCILVWPLMLLLYLLAFAIMAGLLVLPVVGFKFGARMRGRAQQLPGWLLAVVLLGTLVYAVNSALPDDPAKPPAPAKPRGEGKSCPGPEPDMSVPGAVFPWLPALLVGGVMVGMIGPATSPRF